MNRRWLFGRIAAALSALLVSTSALSAGQGPATSGTLKVVGDVPTPLTLSPADLKALPRIQIDLKDSTRTIVYEGVRVAELLKKAGLSLGGDHKENTLAAYVLAVASDGYQVVFSFGELDPALTNSDIIVADTVDGKPLPAFQGVFRMLAPRDSRGARGSAPARTARGRPSP